MKKSKDNISAATDSIDESVHEYHKKFLHKAPFPDTKNEIFPFVPRCDIEEAKNLLREAAPNEALLNLRSMQWLIAHAFTGEPIEEAAIAQIAKNFFKVLSNNLSWEDAFKLPFIPEKTRDLKAERDFEIYAYILFYVRDKDAKRGAVGDALNGAAEKFNVSVETAKKAYQTWKNDRPQDWE